MELVLYLVRVALPPDEDPPGQRVRAPVEPPARDGGVHRRRHRQVVKGVRAQVGEEGHVAQGVVHHVHGHHVLAAILARRGGRGRGWPLSLAESEGVAADGDGGGAVRTGRPAPLNLGKKSNDGFFESGCDQVCQVRKAKKVKSKKKKSHTVNEIMPPPKKTAILSSMFVAFSLGQILD